MIRLGSCFALLSAAAFAADIHPAPGFEVHEWGTFTSIAGNDGMALEWLPFGGPTDLPCFVHRLKLGAKASLAGTVRMETPVIYFYTQQPMSARVHVTFPKGFITEWYPQATQVARFMGSGMAPKGPEIRQPREGEPDSIEWPDVKIEPSVQAPRFPFEFESSHYYAARSTDAAPVTAGGEKEKFLFYRGVGEFQPPIAVEVASDDRVRVRNLAGDALAGVILFENRGGSIRYRAQGSVKATAEITLPESSGDLAGLQMEMEKFLIAQGLFAKEAHAMVQTWQDSWFEEGTRVFYILPSSAVDSILPLEIEPRPQHVARVFVGRVEAITPQIRKSIDTAIAKQDKATLDRYGRFLQPILGDNDRRNYAVQQIYFKYLVASTHCGTQW